MQVRHIPWLFDGSMTFSHLTECVLVTGVSGLAELQKAQQQAAPQAPMGGFGGVPGQQPPQMASGPQGAYG